MDLPDLLRTLLAAMTPVGELRLSIPLGVWTFGLPWYQALSVSLVGNMIPVLVLVPGLDRLSRLLARLPIPAARLLEWRVQHARRSYTPRFRRYGSLALVALVAVPLPLTGAWTGSLAAWAFQVPHRTAIALIGLGVIIAGVVVTVLVELGLHLRVVLAG